ncbi:DoxX family protein [candidate division KSB1 bacterium]|nr:DoxX family protein [candidate division KSB1 bacterium]
MAIKMNTILWIFQILLAIKAISIAVTHGINQHKPTMKDAIERQGESARRRLKITAVCLLVVSVGIILPAGIGKFVWVTTIAAVVFALMALISIPLHMKCHDKPKLIVGLILFLMNAFLAYGRWMIAPLQ